MVLLSAIEVKAFAHIKKNIAHNKSSIEVSFSTPELHSVSSSLANILQCVLIWRKFGYAGLSAFI